MSFYNNKMTVEVGRQEVEPKESGVHEFRDLSQHSTFFRARLLQEFSLLDNIESTASGASSYTSTDFQDKNIRAKILNDAPGSLKFKRFQQDDKEPIDRRLLRTRKRDSVPLGAWALWVMSQYMNSMETMLYYWTGLEIASTTIHFLFLLDIGLKLLDNHTIYSKDLMQQTDLGLSLSLLIPTILFYIYQFDPQMLPFIVSLRMVVVFKLFLRFERFRLILSTVLQALNFMTYIIYFVVLVMVIYAIVGVYIYAPTGYTNSSDPFSWIVWIEINLHLRKMTDPVLSQLYIISWLFFGGFVFDKSIDLQKPEEKVNNRKQQKMEKLRRKPNGESKQKDPSEESAQTLEKVRQLMMQSANETMGDRIYNRLGQSGPRNTPGLSKRTEEYNLAQGYFIPLSASDGAAHGELERVSRDSTVGRSMD
ncbi:hypothetical protein EDD86DRAFT_246223 [Gorgonomyces haynaldii]|nr:hypothetical protein EDD86DRAFT_246223 [Gorgonomyces haynaldii]